MQIYCYETFVSVQIMSRMEKLTIDNESTLRNINGFQIYKLEKKHSRKNIYLINTNDNDTNKT